MASDEKKADEKKAKVDSAPEKTAPVKSDNTEGAAPSKTEGGGTDAGVPSGYSRGEGQKPISQIYRDNWNVIFAKKKKKKKK